MSYLDAFVPISYSPHGGQLHRALGSYKRRWKGVSEQDARKIEIDLAAVLWRFLALHEACLASHATTTFSIVSTVPSGSVTDAEHPLQRTVRDTVAVTRDRY